MSSIKQRHLSAIGDWECTPRIIKFFCSWGICRPEMLDSSRDAVGRLDHPWQGYRSGLLLWCRREIPEQCFSRAFHTLAIYLIILVETHICVHPTANSLGDNIIASNLALWAELGDLYGTWFKPFYTYTLCVYPSKDFLQFQFVSCECQYVESDPEFNLEIGV